MTDLADLLVAGEPATPMPPDRRAMLAVCSYCPDDAVEMLRALGLIPDPYSRGYYKRPTKEQRDGS